MCEPVAAPTLTLPAGWHSNPPPAPLLLYATHPSSTGYDARLTLTVGAHDSLHAMERSLDRYRLIDAGERAVGELVGRWRMARYLARGQVPVTLQQWWVGDALAPACLTATIAHRDFDGLADRVEHAVSTFTLGGRP